jgi:hypothetical protein
VTVDNAGSGRSRRDQARRCLESVLTLFGEPELARPILEIARGIVGDAPNEVRNPVLITVTHALAVPLGLLDRLPPGLSGAS